MSESQPTAQSVNEARGLLRGLSGALQTYLLYPTGHPNRREAVTEMTERAHALVRAGGEPAILFCARGSFYLGPSLLASESIALSRLLRAFEDREIETLEFFSRVSEEDVDMLVRTLLGEQGLQPAGIGVNRLRPSLGHEDDRQREVATLFRTYATGLELLREAAARVASGESVDLESTRNIVEDLADQIQRDPVQALLVTTIKSYDEYTYYHMVNVAMLSIALGFAVGLDREHVILLGVGGLLHDVGKVKISKEVLDHPGQLSEEQWRLIQRHPVDGAGLIYTTTRDLLHPAASIVLEHHAAFDLGGYPDLSNRPHPAMPARLVAVADTFDAVTTNRAYRRAEDRQQALHILQSGAGGGYDPRLVRAFVRLLGVYPIGSLVRLNTGEVGLVVRHHPTESGAPTVRLILDASGSACEPQELDLTERLPDGSPRWSIVQSLDAETVGLDMAALVREGSLQEATQAQQDGQGLVHEPGHSEDPPEGYVDTHAEPHDHHDLPPVDADVAPPFPG